MRSAVRELTLTALRSRELSLAQMKQILKSVTEGVSSGTAKPQIDVKETLQEAFAGMDEAVLKAGQANQIALEQLATQGQSFRQSHMKKALTDLEGLEGELPKPAANRGAKGSSRSGRTSSSKGGLGHRHRCASCCRDGAVRRTNADTHTRATPCNDENGTRAERELLYTREWNPDWAVGGTLAGMEGAERRGQQGRSMETP